MMAQSLAQSPGKSITRTPNAEESDMRFELTNDLGLRPTPQKKLTKREWDELYERQKNFEERKKKAIEMMQLAKEKEIDKELIHKNISKGKKSENNLNREG